MRLVSWKLYRCTFCKHEQLFATNHYGQIYNGSCLNCSWKRPGDITVHECVDVLQALGDLLNEAQGKP